VLKTPYTKQQLVRDIHRNCADADRITEQVKNEICADFGTHTDFHHVDIKKAICCSLVIFDYARDKQLLSEHGNLAEFHQFGEYETAEYSRLVKDGIYLRGVPDLVLNGVITEYKVRHCELNKTIREWVRHSDQLQLYMYITGLREAYLVEEYDCETITSQIHYDAARVEELLIPVHK
jgi:hypothetical protein